MTRNAKPLIHLHLERAMYNHVAREYNQAFNRYNLQITNYNTQGDCVGMVAPFDASAEQQYFIGNPPHIPVIVIPTDDGNIGDEANSTYSAGLDDFVFAEPSSEYLPQLAAGKMNRALQRRKFFSAREASYQLEVLRVDATSISSQTIDTYVREALQSDVIVLKLDDFNNIPIRNICDLITKIRAATGDLHYRPIVVDVTDVYRQKEDISDEVIRFYTAGADSVPTIKSSNGDLVTTIIQSMGYYSTR